MQAVVDGTTRHVDLASGFRVFFLNIIQIIVIVILLSKKKGRKHDVIGVECTKLKN